MHIYMKIVQIDAQLLKIILTQITQKITNTKTRYQQLQTDNRS